MQLTHPADGEMLGCAAGGHRGVVVSDGMAGRRPEPVAWLCPWGVTVATGRTGGALRKVDMDV